MKNPDTDKRQSAVTKSIQQTQKFRMHPNHTFKIREHKEPQINIHPVSKHSYKQPN